MAHKRRVLFHRTWDHFNGGTNGGQLKVKDAFEHFASADDFEPAVYFPPSTVWYDNPGNHWLFYRKQGLTKWEIKANDLLFFSGRDWEILSPEEAEQPPVPIINITQPRHTRANDYRQQFLKYPAIRIVKSSIGKQILDDFGVNGPVYLIPDAIDTAKLPPFNPHPDIDVLILGLKHPGMAKALKVRLNATGFLKRKKWNIAIHVPPGLPTRQDFLRLLNRAKIVVCLPLGAERGSEGFYLPALEAMALEKFVICPFAVGNIDFCIAGKTCLQPQLEVKDLYRVTIQALNMTNADRQNIIRAGKAMLDNHSIDKERNALLALARDVDRIWQDKSLFLTDKASLSDRK
jgi:glycosyltransferase involved in cell wall biosynthesis